jgi:hypothetical protein
MRRHWTSDFVDRGDVHAERRTVTARTHVEAARVVSAGGRARPAEIAVDCHDEDDGSGV